MAFSRAIQNNDPLLCAGLDMAGNKITEVGTPTLNTDFVNKDYMDASVVSGANAFVTSPIVSNQVSVSGLTLGPAPSYAVVTDDVVTFYMQFLDADFPSGSFSFDLTFSDVVLNSLINGDLTAFSTRDGPGGISKASPTAIAGNVVTFTGYSNAANFHDEGAITLTCTITLP